MSGRYRSSAPAAEPLGLATLKAFLRVTDANSDVLLSNLITQAREVFEALTSRSLITQTWKLYLDDWPGGTRDQPAGDRIYLPYPPVSAITSVVCLDTAGASHTIDSSIYALSGYQSDKPAAAVLGFSETWPGLALQPVDGLVVTYTAGYGDSDGDVPRDIQGLLCQMVQFWLDGDPAMDLPGQLLTAICRHRAEWF